MALGCLLFVFAMKGNHLAQVILASFGVCHPFGQQVVSTDKPGLNDIRVKAVNVIFVSIIGCLVFTFHFINQADMYGVKFCYRSLFKCTSQYSDKTIFSQDFRFLHYTPRALHDERVTKSVCCDITPVLPNQTMRIESQDLFGHQ